MRQEDIISSASVMGGGTSQFNSRRSEASATKAKVSPDDVYNQLKGIREELNRVRNAKNEMRKVIKEDYYSSEDEDDHGEDSSDDNIDTD